MREEGPEEPSHSKKRKYSSESAQESEEFLNKRQTNSQNQTGHTEATMIMNKELSLLPTSSIDPFPTLIQSIAMLQDKVASFSSRNNFSFFDSVLPDHQKQQIIHKIAKLKMRVEELASLLPIPSSDLTFADLPDEVKISILSYLDTLNLLTMRLVDTRFSGIASCSTLWKNYCDDKLIKRIRLFKPSFRDYIASTYGKPQGWFGNDNPSLARALELCVERGDIVGVKNLLSRRYRVSGNQDSKELEKGMIYYRTAMEGTYCKSLDWSQEYLLRFLPDSHFSFEENFEKYNYMIVEKDFNENENTYQVTMHDLYCKVAIHELIPKLTVNKLEIANEIFDFVKAFFENYRTLPKKIRRLYDIKKYGTPLTWGLYCYQDTSYIQQLLEDDEGCIDEGFPLNIAIERDLASHVIILLDAGAILFDTESEDESEDEEEETIYIKYFRYAMSVNSIKTAHAILEKYLQEIPLWLITGYLEEAFLEYKLKNDSTVTQEEKDDEFFEVRPFEMRAARCMSLLIKYGANIDLYRGGKTKLMEAVLLRQEKIVKILLNLGADITMSTNTNENILDLTLKSHTNFMVDIFQNWYNYLPTKDLNDLQRNFVKFCEYFCQALALILKADKESRMLSIEELEKICVYFSNLEKINSTYFHAKLIHLSQTTWCSTTRLEEIIPSVREIIPAEITQKILDELAKKEEKNIADRADAQLTMTLTP